MVESTTRGLKDYFHFGIIFLGILFMLGGVVMSTVWVVVLGFVLIAMGMAYFLVHSYDRN